jgi:hypothetical protein
MKRAWRWALAFGPVLSGPAASQGPVNEALTVCLDRNVPLAGGQDGAGFDTKVAEAVARHLDRPLVVQWFTSKMEAESSTALTANALLSDGKCQLVGGYPLVADALGKPGEATARLPDYDGMKAADRTRRVVLGELLSSTPYYQEVVTIIFGSTAASRSMSTLADLVGVKIGVESGTFADAVLMSFKDGRLVDNLTHIVPGRGELLPRLEHGDFDAALIDLRRFDSYRAANPATTLRASGYYYRIGFNMGFAALSTQQELLGQVNAAIGDMKAELPELAQTSGTTWVAPRQPDILGHFSLTDLRD